MLVLVPMLARRGVEVPVLAWRGVEFMVQCRRWRGAAQSFRRDLAAGAAGREVRGAMFLSWRGVARRDAVHVCNRASWAADLCLYESCL